AMFDAVEGLRARAQAPSRAPEARWLLDLLVDVEAGRRVDALLVGRAGALVRRVGAVVVEVREGLGGEPAPAEPGRVVRRAEVVVEVVRLLLLEVQAVPDAVVRPLRHVVVAGPARAGAGGHTAAARAVVAVLNRVGRTDAGVGEHRAGSRRVVGRAHVRRLVADRTAGAQRHGSAALDVLLVEVG